jgi:hypothetical protein
MDLTLTGDEASTRPFASVLIALSRYALQWHSLRIDLPASAAQILLTGLSSLPRLASIHIGQTFLITENTRHFNWFSMAPQVKELTFDGPFDYSFITRQRFPNLWSLTLSFANISNVPDGAGTLNLPARHLHICYHVRKPGWLYQYLDLLILPNLSTLEFSLGSITRYQARPYIDLIVRSQLNLQKLIFHGRATAGISVLKEVGKLFAFCPNLLELRLTEMSEPSALEFLMHTIGGVSVTPNLQRLHIECTSQIISESHRLSSFHSLGESLYEFKSTHTCSIRMEISIGAKNREQGEKLKEATRSWATAGLEVSLSVGLVVVISL